MPLSWTALLTEATLVFLLISSDHMSLESSLNERCLEIMWVQSTKNKKQTDILNLKNVNLDAVCFLTFSYMK